MAQEILADGTLHGIIRNQINSNFFELYQAIEREVKTPSDFYVEGDISDSESINRGIDWALNNNGWLHCPKALYELHLPTPRIDRAMKLSGNGKLNTVFRIAPTMVGDVLSTFQLSFTLSGWGVNGNTVSLANQRTGVEITGIRILGQRDAAGRQNGLMLYGITDNIRVTNMLIDYLNGMGLGLAQQTAGAPDGYCRESYFEDVQVRCCGNVDLDIPAAEIASYGGGDATNHVVFVDCKFVWASGEQLRIINRKTSGVAIRFLSFFGLMIHGKENPSTPIASHLLRLMGLVSSSTFYGMEFESAYTGYYALTFEEFGAAGRSPRGIYMSGGNGSGANGVWIQYGRNITLDFTELAVDGIELKVDGTVIGSINILGYQAFEWTIDINVNAYQFVAFKGARGQYVATSLPDKDKWRNTITRAVNGWTANDGIVVATSAGWRGVQLALNDPASADTFAKYATVGFNAVSLTPRTAAQITTDNAPEGALVYSSSVGGFGRKKGDGLIALEVYRNSVPTVGTHTAGDKVLRPGINPTSPVAEYTCTVSGTPGTWKATSWHVMRGNTAGRPTLTVDDVGVEYQDTTLAAAGKPIWWTGTAWVDATGVAV